MSQLYCRQSTPHLPASWCEVFYHPRGGQDWGADGRGGSDGSSFMVYSYSLHTNLFWHLFSRCFSSRAMKLCRLLAPTNSHWHGCNYCTGKGQVKHSFRVLRPDLLNVLLLEPGGSKFFHFRKFDHVIHLIYTRTRFVTNGSFVAQRGSRFRLHCAIRVQNH